jgi:hypothetical protein
MQKYDNTVELNQEMDRQTQLNFLSCLLFNTTYFGVNWHFWILHGLIYTWHKGCTNYILIQINLLTSVYNRVSL